MSIQDYSVSVNGVSTPGKVVLGDYEVPVDPMDDLWCDSCQ